MKDLQAVEPQSNESENEIYVFTDGNCKNNGRKNAKAGYAVFFTEDEGSRFYNHNTTGLVAIDPTNQRAELKAMQKMFELVADNISMFEGHALVVCTDSMYSMKCITDWSKNWMKNNWKTSKGEDVKNREIIESILNLKNIVSEKIPVRFKHVFSHAVEPADKSSTAHFLWKGNMIVDGMINKLLSE
jgi:ribonuclease HI